MLSRPPRTGSPPHLRRQPGDMLVSRFLSGLLEATRRLLPPELTLQARQQGGLIKFFDADPAIHFELWLHRARKRVELGLHFETPDPNRNARLLAFVIDELPFLKAALGESLEAEPWDRGWTRLYLTRPLGRLGPAEQADLAAAFAEFIGVLEPLRQDACSSC